MSKVKLAESQSERLQSSCKEEDIDISEEEPCAAREGPQDQQAASFAQQDVYVKPSGYITALLADLPAAERLTKDQTLFMARFAKACDEVWEDEGKPPQQRRVHHIL